MLIETIAQDIRYAARSLRKSASFTVTSIAVLALAIGANTAMFSVLNAALLKPLSYPSPEQLAMLWTEIPSAGLREGRSAFWNVEQWREQSKSLADLAAFDPASATLTTADGSERVTVVRVTPNLFSLLGVQPVQGRMFSAEEAEQRKRVAVISDRFWQARFGGSQQAIGATIELDGLPSQIIGIVPTSLRFLGDASVFEPHTMVPDWESRRADRGAGAWFALGRLRTNRMFWQGHAEMCVLPLYS